MEFEERAADPLAGGMMYGYQCGMLWGATLAAGAQAYRILGKSPRAEAWAMIAARRLMESFRAQNKYINCLEITEVDVSAPTIQMVMRFLLKSGARGSCLGMAARCAKASFGEINAALSQNSPEVPPAPVSCAAMLAQRMGASDLHTVMAAGLAGGIGLSGGACGALAATLWITEISRLKGADERSLRTSGAIGRFLESTHDEFECSRIVGRKFESVADHASYLRAGGCSELIKVLAAL